MTIQDEEAKKEAKRLYFREYRKKNPEKVQAAHERFWMKKLAAMQAHKTIEKEE